MAAVPNLPIVFDKNGVAYIEGTTTKVIEVALAKETSGLTPEELQTELPHLTRAQVYAALAYYYAHQAELDAEIERRYHYAEAKQPQAGESPFARRLRETDKQPDTERVVVSGILDRLSGSTRSFTLKLPEGQKLRGSLPPNGDLNDYRQLVGKKVVVDGQISFRPSGKTAGFEASHIQKASPEDSIWEHLPRPHPRSLSDLKPNHPLPSGANGMQRIIGRWPGDETDEQIQAALEEIS